MAIKRLFVLILAVPLVLLNVPVGAENVVEGASNTARWQQANIPAQGGEHGWLLAGGSDITCLAIDSNGILYAGVTGLPSNFYRSVDDGNSWQAVGSGSDTVVDIVITPEDAVYYATAYDIYRLLDGVITLVASLPGRSASPGPAITSIDVSFYNGGYAVLVGTRNENNGQFGGVYVVSGEVFLQWQDLGLAGCDVYSVAFSPHFGEDNFVVALATDETGTFVTWKEGSSGWGSTVGDAMLTDGGTGSPVVVTGTAEIAFPDDYSSNAGSGNCVLYAAVDTGTAGGDVYAVYGRGIPGQSVAEDLDVAACCGEDNIDITGFDICGSTGSIYMMAGASAGGDVYMSSDSGESWRQSGKPPTGGGSTFVLMSAGYKNNGKAYCATGGSESAFSMSCDYGMNWNQRGLIDTTIDIVLDAAVSPRYSDDETVFLLTWGGEYSLWRSMDGCGNWERIISSSVVNPIVIDRVGISPQYGVESHVLYLCGSADGNPSIWKTVDRGQSFSARDAPFAIDQWKVVGDTSFYIAGEDSQALLYKTTNSGVRYAAKAAVGGEMLTSIAVSPSYSSDKTVLVGNSNGGVYLSTDGGVTFAPLGDAASPLEGGISVAFDAGYAGNNTVYAAGDMPGNGVYSFTIGESTVWESIDSTLPSGAMIGDMGVSGNGTLYAVNFQQVDAAGAKGGVERCLSPSSSPVFETFNSGLNIDASLDGFWVSGNTVWSLDIDNNCLVFFTDSLSQKVTLTSPADDSTVKGDVSGTAVKSVLLDWEPLDGASVYRWQLGSDDNFSPSSIISEDITDSSSLKLTLLEAGNEYYWRIRAVEPVLSRWSDVWTFTPEALSELGAPVLETPAAGAVNVPVNTMFQWTAVKGAEGYEMEVSAQYDFSNVAVRLAGDASLPVNAWRNQAAFSYDTTYYWRVRAVNPDAVGTWSGAGVFSTEPAAAVQTLITTSAITEQAQTTQTSASFSTVEKLTTTVSTEFSTVTIVQTQAAPASQGILIVPDWLYCALGFMALLVVMLLTAILLIITKRRQ
jgi:hypothetical protein